MKNLKSFIGIFILLSFAFVLFSSQAQAQNNPQTKGYSVVFDLGTVTNSGQETGYLDLRGWSKIDSVTVSLSATNETDIDTVNFFLGNYTQDGFVKDAAAGVIYQASTIDVANAATDFLNLVTSVNTTPLTGVALRGCNGLYFEIEAQATGNDATDPNALYIHFKIHGTK